MRCPSDKAHLATLTQLRERRLKPAPGQRPCDRYWQGQGWVQLYDPAAAIGMRDRRAPSAAQLAALQAGRALAGSVVCAGCGARVARELVEGRVCVACRDRSRQEDWEQDQAAARRSAGVAAARWFAAGARFVDVETTGLDHEAEIIEIAVVDAAGQILLDTLIKPQQPVPSEATAIHGITDDMLAGAPTWLAIGHRVLGLLGQGSAVAHNAAFEAQMLRQACARHGLAPPAPSWGCTMDELAALNDGWYPALETAAQLLQVRRPPGAHRGLRDALLCREIALAMCRLAPSGPLEERLDAA